MEITTAIYMKPRNCGGCYDWQTGGGPPSHICKECENSHTIRCRIHKLGNILSRVTFEGEFKTRTVLTSRLRKIEDPVFVTGCSDPTQPEYDDSVTTSTPIKVRVYRKGEISNGTKYPF